MTSIKDWQDSMSEVDGWAEAVDYIDEEVTLRPSTADNGSCLVVLKSYANTGSSLVVLQSYLRPTARRRQVAQEAPNWTQEAPSWPRRRSGGAKLSPRDNNLGPRGAK